LVAWTWEVTMHLGKQRVPVNRDNIDDHIDLPDLEALVGRLNIGPGRSPRSSRG
jgi:hypothetical protein